jgi:hypothetical protein
MNVDELTLLRRLAVDEPADADAARAEVWRRLNGGELQASERRPDGGTRLPSRRVVAIAALVVVLAFVAPASRSGITSSATAVQAGRRADTCLVARRTTLAFVSQRDGNPRSMMNADGGAQENLTRSPRATAIPAGARRTEARVRADATATPRST